MKKIISLLVFGFWVVSAAQAGAKELLVLSGDKSKNSKRWQEEVLPGYGETEAGKQLPAKIVPIQGNNFPGWLSQALQEDRVGEIIGTPTFIIWDDVGKKEIGRVEGYTEKTNFYSQLEEALTMIDQGLTPGRREGSGGDHREEGSGGAQREEGSGGDRRDGGSSTMSRDIMDHMYKTPEEARRASEMLGFGGEIHSHETPEGLIYMPGPMM